MNIYENVKRFCDIKGMSISTLERAANLSNGSISKWKTKTPKVDNLYSVAKVLDTSIESILTGELENIHDSRNNSDISKEDKMFVEKYQKLSDCEKQIILGKISEFLYNKKMEASSEKLSSKVLWDLLVDQSDKNPVMTKNND